MGEIVAKDFSGGKGNRLAVFPCPFQYRKLDSMDPQRGRTEKGPEKCVIGKGSWCKNCIHYHLWRVGTQKMRRRDELIQRTGKAPWLWKKVNAFPRGLHL